MHPLSPNFAFLDGTRCNEYAYQNAQCPKFEQEFTYGLSIDTDLDDLEWCNSTYSAFFHRI